MKPALANVLSTPCTLFGILYDEYAPMIKTNINELVIKEENMRDNILNEHLNTLCPI